MVLYPNAGGSDFSDFLLKILPLPIAIATPEVKIAAINDAAKTFFCLSNDEAPLRPCGEVMKCVHAFEAAGCGATASCRRCLIRNSVFQALQGQVVIREKGKFDVWQKEEIKRLTLLITTAPLNYRDTRMAVILIEDISLITQIEGLLPICASCKKIRSADGKWLPIDRYIATHSEAEFTHDYCPDCRDKALALLKGKN